MTLPFVLDADLAPDGNINRDYGEGWTVLHCAAAIGDTASILKILQKGGDVTLKTSLRLDRLKTVLAELPIAVALRYKKG